MILITNNNPRLQRGVKPDTTGGKPVEDFILKIAYNYAFCDNIFSAFFKSSG